jgi:transcriptional regulator with GAF, ATPase, and Fis domain
MLAYLVLREGSKFSDVVRLVPGEPVVIGRAPTCQVLLRDERCSRQHAEVRFADGHWSLRDLGSRNGTAVGKTLLRGPHALQPGDVIRLGRSQLVFVHELAHAFDGGGAGQRQAAGDRAVEVDETLQEVEAGAARPGATTRITYRRGHTRFLEPGEGDTNGLPRRGRAANRLCRLAFELATCTEREQLAQAALAGLFEATQIDAGAVLLFSEDHYASQAASASSDLNVAELAVVASRSDTPRSYMAVSDSLAGTVLRDGEAVLARHVEGAPQPSDDPEQAASSVICSPVRRGERTFGLIHLYSTQPARIPDPDDLEFTLAVAETLGVALENLSQRQQLADHLLHARGENEQLREQLGAQSEIVGRSSVLAKVRAQIARVGASNAIVLIRGESGVGKELVARALHLSSPRRDSVFVCLNCAALTESLLESELFGHEKGAFTGATERKIGKFEAAHGGTIFLDEIGEMSPHLQAKFLRVLEGHAYERVGGSQEIRVDVRVIAATNRDLEKEVEQGTFRRDLYFRLRVVEIIVPGLRKRPEDIPILAQHFLERYSRETGRRIRGFTQQALDQMLRYRWPGNVRELKNVIERAVVLCEGQQIDVGDLMLSKLATSGETTESSVPAAEFTPMPLTELERRHILATLKATGWNKSQTAQILGIERSTLDRKIRRYGIRKQT